MNKKNTLTILIVAILSSSLTLFGYNQMMKRNNSSSSSTHSDAFDQGANLQLASMTTPDGYPDFREAAEKTIHGVVHVKTKSVRQQQMMSPFDFLFGFGEPGMSQPREQLSFGSGVIISKDGFIITNNHVVDNANEVSVTLNDNREFTAKVIGTDSQSDIALLKIEGDNFPFIPFGNSDDLKVGEWVLAVGNPFNLTSTVTAGIVSAKNRGNITGSNGIQSFIQTDAAVNRGNSGGALVNTRGELVGINTAIYSQTGDFAGYAFAIPISTAGKVAADLKQYGSVQRALLGIQVLPIEELKMRDPKRASELSKIQGVIIDGFADRSPAKAAGMEKGDVIKAINNVRINTFAELQNQLSRFRPGDKVVVSVDRKGNEKKYTVELKNLEGNTDITRPTEIISKLGVNFQTISNQEKQQLGITNGVKVNDVAKDGLFRKNVINKGFIILRINNMPINTVDDVTSIVKSINSSSQDKVLLVAGFYPNGRTQYIAIDLSDR